MSCEVPGSPLELCTGQPRAWCGREQPPTATLLLQVTRPQGDAAQGSPSKGIDAVGPGYQQVSDIKSPQASSGKVMSCVPNGRVFTSSKPGHLQAYCASSQLFCLRLEGPLDPLTTLASLV